jgi:HAD superfamily hydrolase (TIGR01509 family)
MDGTIVDTRAFHMAAWSELVERLDLPPRCFDLAQSGFGKTNWAIFHEWFGAQAPEHDFAALSAEKEEAFREKIHGHVRARAGFRDLLDAARARGLRVALATSGPRENAEFLLRELGVAARFDAVVWGHAGLRSKPAPDSFLLAARRLGLHPGRCLGFEDSRHGFLSVRRAGMGLVAIAEQPGDLGINRRWTPWSFRDFTPVPALIERLNRNQQD